MAGKAWKGWKWLEITEGMELDGNGLKWFNLVGNDWNGWNGCNGQKLLEMTEISGNCWKLLEIAGMAGNVLKLLKIAGMTGGSIL